MKHSIIITAISTVILTGCGITHIVTVAPEEYRPVTTGTTVVTTGTYQPITYSTSVIAPRANTITTTTRVTATTPDISLNLDLQAVGAAFAQSSTIQEFETLLNNSSYMLSNLDLNGDGYVDYLRVVETVEGYNHVFVIQAVLSPNVYQDVATVVAEVPTVNTACVQIIGSPYIYGTRYVIQPVFITTPIIYAHLMRPGYRPWNSPWYWDHFPPHYRRPAPIHYGHYQAYVDTYMRNHRFCHEVHIVHEYHYHDYDRVYNSIRRNDYGDRHPEQSFAVRTANIPARNNSTGVRNTSDIREAMRANTTTQVTSSGRSTRSANVTTATSGRSTAASTTASQSTTTGGSARSASVGQTRTVTPSATGSSQPRTVTPSTSGTSQTRTATTSTATTSQTTTTSSRVRSSGTTSTQVTRNSSPRTSSAVSGSSSTTPSRSTSTSSSTVTSRTPSRSTSTSSSNGSASRSTGSRSTAGSTSTGSRSTSGSRR